MQMQHMYAMPSTFIQRDIDGPLARAFLLAVLPSNGNIEALLGSAIFSHFTSSARSLSTSPLHAWQRGFPRSLLSSCVSIAHRHDEAW